MNGSLTLHAMIAFSLPQAYAGCRVMRRTYFGGAPTLIRASTRCVRDKDSNYAPPLLSHDHDIAFT